MIFRLGKRRTPVRAAACVPERCRVYAIGDVHGRADLLNDLAARIEADLKNIDCDEILTVFLGDYVDRGPNPAAVIARLSSGDFPTPIVALRGNHEAMLLNFLDDETALDLWRLNGGLETLHSYKVNVTDLMRGQGYKLAQEKFYANLPSKDLECLKAMKCHFVVGDYFFCHAGVRPGISLEGQSDNDLMWIREEFLTSDFDFGKIIIHGHTPVSSPDIRPNRINIDTGAFATNTLTCLVLQGANRRFIST
jgi:serine/threonine protein phosphatase 1